MTRPVTIGAAQSGPIRRDDSREMVVERLIAQMREARRQECDLVVFTECALTAFFPHWWIDDEVELDAWFERQMPGPQTRPLFNEAARLGIAFHLGYAELAVEDGRQRRFNSSILVGKHGEIIGRYRKIHLPGHREYRQGHPFQNLEKRYFEVGNLPLSAWSAFSGVVGLCICNDRRWPETFRLLGLKGAELILLGYNTPKMIPEYPEIGPLAGFHHELCLQAGAYQNGCWVVAVAKAGVEEGVDQIGLTSIVAPSGTIVAQSRSLADELIIHSCDLDEARAYKDLFDIKGNRRVEHYGPLVADPNVPE